MNDHATLKEANVSYRDAVRGEYYIGVEWDRCYHICLKDRMIGKVFLIDGTEGQAYGGAECVYIQWIELEERYRGKGYIKDVIECLKKEFSHKKYITAQTSDDHLDMYIHIGFESTGRDPCTFYEMSNIRIPVP